MTGDFLIAEVNETLKIVKLVVDKRKPVNELERLFFFKHLFLTRKTYVCNKYLLLFTMGFERNAKSVTWILIYNLPICT